MAPGEEGTLISQIYINNTYMHSVISAPPGKEFSITKLLKPGRSQIHCKNNLQNSILAGQSNSSNVVTVTVQGEGLNPPPYSHLWPLASSSCLVGPVSMSSLLLKPLALKDLADFCC